MYAEERQLCWQGDRVTRIQGVEPVAKDELPCLGLLHAREGRVVAMRHKVMVDNYVRV